MEESGWGNSSETKEANQKEENSETSGRPQLGTESPSKEHVEDLKQRNRKYFSIREIFSNQTNYNQKMFFYFLIENRKSEVEKIGKESFSNGQTTIRFRKFIAT